MLTTQFTHLVSRVGLTSSYTAVSHLLPSPSHQATASLDRIMTHAASSSFRIRSLEPQLTSTPRHGSTPINPARAGGEKAKRLGFDRHPQKLCLGLAVGLKCRSLRRTKACAAAVTAHRRAQLHIFRAVGNGVWGLLCSVWLDPAGHQMTIPSSELRVPCLS